MTQRLAGKVAVVTAAGRAHGRSGVRSTLKYSRLSETERIGCPWAGGGKIIGAGMNYAGHAAVSRMANPVQPELIDG